MKFNKRAFDLLGIGRESVKISSRTQSINNVGRAELTTADITVEAFTRPLGRTDLVQIDIGNLDVDDRYFYFDDTVEIKNNDIIEHNNTKYTVRSIDPRAHGGFIVVIGKNRSRKG